MVLILECMIICLILLVPCVVAIANGIHNAAFLFERDVQDRVVEMGLVTREHLDRNKKGFKYTTLLIMVAFVIWAVYGINGARGFWNPFWQIYALAMAEGLLGRFFIDWYWVGHAVNLWCDRALSVTPNGKITLATMKEIDNPKGMEKLYEGVDASVPMKSAVFGVMSLVLQFFGYFSIAYFVRTFSEVFGIILFAGSTVFAILGSGHHMKYALGVWMFIKGGRDERAYELLSGLYHGGNATKLAYFGNDNLSRLNIFDFYEVRKGVRLHCGSFPDAVCGGRFYSGQEISWDGAKGCAGKGSGS